MHTVLTVKLHIGPDLTPGSDLDSAGIHNVAIRSYVCVIANLNVVAIITMKWRFNIAELSQAIFHFRIFQAVVALRLEYFAEMRVLLGIVLLAWIRGFVEFIYCNLAFSPLLHKFRVLGIEWVLVDHFRFLVGEILGMRHWGACFML